jgi:hypothetical protein
MKLVKPNKLLYIKTHKLLFCFLPSGKTEQKFIETREDQEKLFRLIQRGEVTIASSNVSRH